MSSCDINKLCTDLLSQLEKDLNSKIVELVDGEEFRKKVVIILGDKAATEALEDIYPQILNYAFERLSDRICESDSMIARKGENMENEESLKELNEILPMKLNEVMKQKSGIASSYCDNVRKRRRDTKTSIYDDSINDITSDLDKGKDEIDNNGEKLVSNKNAKEVYPTNQNQRNCKSKKDDLDCKRFLHSTFELLLSIFPTLNKRKLRSNLTKNVNNLMTYKITLLRDCIRNNVEDGNEVSDAAFELLDMWSKEAEDNESTCKNEKSNMNINNENTNCSSDSSEICCKNNALNESNKSEATFESGSVTLKEKIKFLEEVIPGLNDDISQDLSQCSSLGDVQKVVSKYLEDTKSPSKIEYNSGFRALDFIVSGQNPLSETYRTSSYEQQDPLSINNARSNCEFVNVPEAISNPSTSNSLIINETGLKRKSSSKKVEHITSKLENRKEVSIEETLENTIKTEHASVDSFKMKNASFDNSKLCTEADAICSLLPFASFKNIYQSLMDHFYHPQRKVKVLTEYIDLALENGQEVESKVFETLFLWQMNKEKFNTIEQGAVPKKKVSKAETDIDYALLSLPSTSKEEKASYVYKKDNCIKEEANHIPLKNEKDLVYFNSLPKEEQAWYMKKVTFLAEISHLSEEFILSKILYCSNEDEIMQMAGKLLENQESSQETSSSTSALKDNSLSDLEPPPKKVKQQDGNSTASKKTSSSSPTKSSVSENDSTKVTATAITTSVRNSQSSLNSGGAASSSSDDIVSSNTSSAADIEDLIQSHIQQLGEIFPDADPDFLSERANDIAGDQEAFVDLVVELTEDRSYPKMEEYLRRQRKMNMRKKFIEGMGVEEFLGYFEDPEKVFSNTTKEMSILYRSNARAQLMKDYPFQLSRTIDSVFKLHNYHYLPTLRALKAEKGARKTKRTAGGQLPGDLDDIFLKEFCYVRMEGKIREYYLQKKMEDEQSFLKAKEAGELLECRCCYDDEILIRNMSSCESEEQDPPHLFCNSCIKRYAEEQIGQGRLHFTCLEGECKADFSLKTLKAVLKPSIFSNLLKQKQAEEIAAAGITDLESCPFCNFATIMPNKDDKVFRCLNPECFKDSCRLCKELNHIPLRCDEVEKKKQTETRTFLENEMSEAMVRECYKCKRRFIKEEGCNKMVCSCGAMMCYLCKAPIRGYDHFSSESRATSKASESDKCPLWTNSLQLHAEEVQKRVAEAKLKIDPNIRLKYDPTEDMPQVPQYLKKAQQAPAARVPQRRLDFPGHLPRAEGRGQDVPIDHYREQIGHLAANFLPQMMADLLQAEHRRIQRHRHHHQHQHFYFPYHHHTLPHPHPVPPPHHPPPNNNPFNYSPLLHRQLPPLPHNYNPHYPHRAPPIRVPPSAPLPSQALPQRWAAHPGAGVPLTPPPPHLPPHRHPHHQSLPFNHRLPYHRSGTPAPHSPGPPPPAAPQSPVANPAPPVAGAFGRQRGNHGNGGSNRHHHYPHPYHHQLQPYRHNPNNNSNNGNARQGGGNPPSNGGPFKY